MLVLKEYVADVKNIPNKFVIKLGTGSDRANSLFIGTIPNDKNVFSFEYSSPNTYREYDNSNAAIFPRFK
jgi:hypothetical protein